MLIINSILTNNIATNHVVSIYYNIINFPSCVVSWPNTILDDTNIARLPITKLNLYT
ncbi:hypothetical protein F-VV57_0160 [Faustovirus]|nr:hypothetical protein F-VV57_0160 [Faustovirus]QJX73427.1 hypothetical protein F-VV63_0161 [Faustovirus]